MMYQGDTFFHLSIPGQIGLVLLSGCLALLLLWVFWKTSSRFGTLVKVLLAFLCLWGFVWISPQVYYLYYWLIFEDLPLQMVIQSPPGIQTIVELISFKGKATLSDHSKGALFWLMILMVIVRAPPK